MKSAEWVFDDICDKIITDVEVCLTEESERIKTKGIWDTGNSKSSITLSLAEQLGIKPRDFLGVNTSTGKHDFPCCEITILVKGEPFRTWVVICPIEKFDNEVDVLVGMSVMKRGDFGFTNRNGHTEMVFRIPPQGHIGVKEPWLKRTLRKLAERYL